MTSPHHHHSSSHGGDDDVVSPTIRVTPIPDSFDSGGTSSSTTSAAIGSSSASNSASSSRHNSLDINFSASALSDASSAAGAQNASSSSSRVASPLLPRPQRDIKNLIHFRIPHEVTPTASKRAISPNAASSISGNTSANAGTSGNTTTGKSTWAAAIAASVQTGGGKRGSLSKNTSAANTPSHAASSTVVPPSAVPVAAVASVAPAPTAASSTSTSAPASLSTTHSSNSNSPPHTTNTSTSSTPTSSSSQQNAWHRSDKPQFGAPVAVAATSTSASSAATAAAVSKPNTTKTAPATKKPTKSTSSSSSKSTFEKEISTKKPSNSTGSTGSASNSRSSSMSRPTSSSAASLSTSSTAASSSSTAPKKPSTPSGSSSNAAAKPSSKKPSDASTPVHRTSIDTSDPSSTSLPTVIESALSRANSSSHDIQHALSSMRASTDAAYDDPATATPPSIPETPPDSDLLGPLPSSIAATAVPTLSLTRRTTASLTTAPLTSGKVVKSSGSSELTKRLWSHLLDNLSRTTNELFYLCHMHMSTTQAARCRQVLYHLQSSTKDFTKLLEHAEQKKISTSSSTTSLRGTSSSTTSSSTAAPASSSSSSLTHAPSSASSSSVAKPLSRSRKSVASASTASSSSTSSSSTARTTKTVPKPALSPRSKPMHVEDDKEEAHKKSDLKSVKHADNESESIEIEPIPPAASHQQHMSVGEGSLFGLLGLTPLMSSDAPDAPRSPPHSRSTRVTLDEPDDELPPNSTPTTAEPSSSFFDDYTLSTSNKPPLVPKSAWTSHSQTQQMLSAHKTKSSAGLSTHASSFKPSQLILSPENSVIIHATPEMTADGQPINITPPRSAVNNTSRFPAEDSSSTVPASSLAESLQRRLNSPERVQMRHRPPTAFHESSAATGDATSRPHTSDDPDPIVAAHLQSLVQSKQDKAARNREEVLASKRKQGEIVSTRLTDAELRREERVRSKGEHSETRQAIAAEHAEEALESRRRRAENENQKVKELAFINEQAMEERKYAFAAKTESHDARVRLLTAQRLEKLNATNSRTTAVVDEKRRAERESIGKKSAEHEKIDARLELAEARRIQGKNKSSLKGPLANLSAMGTPSESPFMSPRPGSAADMHTGLEPYTIQADDSQAYATATAAAELLLNETEALPEIDANYCTLCKVKLNTDEYVRRHVAGKKHQSLLAEQLIKGQNPSTPAAPNDAAASSSPSTLPPSTPAPGAVDTYIVSLSSLAASTSASTSNPSNNKPTRFISEPMSLTAPSKSSRRNQKKKARKLRQQLTSANGDDEGDDAAEDDEGGDEDTTSSSQQQSSKKKEKDADQGVEELAAFPSTRLQTQVTSLVNAIDRNAAPASSSNSSSSVRVSEEVEQSLQEELASVLVRLDEEQSLKSDSTLPISPPALKVLLVSRVISCFLANPLSSSGTSTYSSETMRLASEIVYSCCRSSSVVCRTLVSKQKFIPLVDLTCRSLHCMDLVHHSNANNLTPVSPTAYLEFLIQALTIVLNEEDEPIQLSSSHTSPQKPNEEEKQPVESNDAASQAQAQQRAAYFKDRQALVRYICLSGLLSRISQQFLTVDQYLTRVPSASVSASSMALVASLNASSLSAAASSSKPSPNSTPKLGPRLLTSKERLTSKLAQQRSLKADKTAPTAATIPKQSHIPTHAPIVPHIEFYVHLVQFLSALTTLPANLASPPTYNTALVKALKDTGVAGILSILSALTLSHWIIPAQKVATTIAQIPSSVSSLPVPSSAILPSSSISSSRSISTRDQALSTVLSHDAATILLTALRLLNNISRHDRALLQDFSERYQPHLFELLCFLLPYTVSHLPKPNITTTTVHTHIIEAVITFIGGIALLSQSNQRMMYEWKLDESTQSASANASSSSSSIIATAPSVEDDAPSDSQTIYQQLCHLPSHFFTDLRYQNLVFPTILSIVFNPSQPSETKGLMTELGPHAAAIVEWMEVMSSGATKLVESSAPTESESSAASAAANSPAVHASSSDEPPLPRSASHTGLLPTTTGAALRGSPPVSPGLHSGKPSGASSSSAAFSSSSSSLIMSRKRSNSGTDPPANSTKIAAEIAAKEKRKTLTTKINPPVNHKKSAAPLPPTAKSKAGATSAKSVTASSSNAVSSPAAPDEPSIEITPVTPVPLVSIPAPPQLSAAPVVLPNTIAPSIRADLTRRFPLELWKQARVSLF